MNTTQLECFMSVANFLNFSRAAEQLGLTQPAVSHQINTLEDELGAKLFYRTSKRVRLTQEGHLFSQYAQEILSLSRMSKARLKESHVTSVIRFGIGCRSFLELRLLAPVLQQLRQEFPRLLPVLRLIPFDSLENLLEEIVGEIRDEYDEDEEEDIKEILPGKEYQVLGSAKLNDINEQLNLKLDSEDYDSIGGYIIEQLDKLPVQGQSVTLPSGLRLVVEKTSKNRVELVHLYLPEPEELDEEEE